MKLNDELRLLGAKYQPTKRTKTIDGQPRDVYLMDELAGLANKVQALEERNDKLDGENVLLLSDLRAAKKDASEAWDQLGNESA